MNKTLLTNPQMFAGKVHTTEMSAKEFKNGNDVKSMKKCLISACTAGKKKSTGSAQKSLLEAFDSSEDEEAQGQQQSCSTEESDDSSSDDSPSHDSSDSSSEESESSGGEETAKTKSSNVPASKDMNKIGSEEARGPSASSGISLYCQEGEDTNR